MTSGRRTEPAAPEPTTYTLPERYASIEGSSRGIIQVSVLPDTASTEDKQFRVILSGYRNCLAGSTSTIQVTVENTDAVRPEPQPEDPPTINVFDSSLEIPASGTATGGLTISTSRPLAESISGTITTSGGTATAGTHYTALTNTAWTIPAGQTSVDVPITLRSAAITADLTFNARIALTTDNASLGDRDAVFTITQTAEPTDIQVRDLNLSDAATTRASVVVTRTGNLQPISFRVNTIDGTARSGVRYRPIVNRLVRMIQGQRAATITVDIIRPVGRVPQATFRLRASALSPSGTISDTDGIITLPSYEPVVQTTPYIDMASGTQQEPSSGFANMEFTIKASKVWASPIRGTFVTSNISARAGSDYTRVSTNWVIPVGSRSVVVRVPILADTATEQNETFRAVIAISSENARFRSGQARLSATGTIRNRQQIATSLSVGDVTAPNRTSGTVNVPVNRTGSTAQAAFFTAETYSTGSATAGTDYQSIVNRRSRIEAGRSSISIPVTIPAPTEAQPRETFGLLIHSARGATISDDRGIVTLPAAQAPLFAAFTDPFISMEIRSEAAVRQAYFFVSVPVFLSRAASSSVTINYHIRLVWNVVGSPANVLADTFSTLTIPAGQVTGLLQVQSARTNVGASTLATIVAGIIGALGTLGLGTATFAVTIPTATGALTFTGANAVLQAFLYTGQSIIATAASAIIASSLVATSGGISLITNSPARNSGVIAVGNTTPLTRTQREDILGKLLHRSEIAIPGTSIAATVRVTGYSSQFDQRQPATLRSGISY